MASPGGPFLASPTGNQLRPDGSREAAPFLTGPQLQEGKAEPTILEAVEPTSHDLGKPPRPLKPSWIIRFNTTWLPEAIGLILSASSLIAMVVLLEKYDGQRQPDWGSVSYNTIISVLATASRMLALFGATSALSQMKWIWFAKQQHALADFYTFDASTRGLPGAAGLIWFLQGRHMAVIGALAVVLGAAADPFAQQVVHYYEADFVDVSQSAWVSRANNYSAHTNTSNDLSESTADSALVANTVTALYQATQETLLQPRFSCGTKNCIWPRFTTLAFCPVCVDVSPSISKTCTYPGACSITLPGAGLDADFAASPSYMILNGTSPGNAIVLKNATWPLVVYQAIRAIVDPSLPGNGAVVLNSSTPWAGTECTLSPCVLSLEASIVNGSYKEKTLDTWTKLEQDNSTYPAAIRLRPPWGSEQGMQAGQSFEISSEAVAALAGSSSRDGNLLGDQLMGLVHTTDDLSGIDFFGPPVGSSRPWNTALQVLFYANFTDTTCPTPQDNVACSFRALGGGLTKAIRDATAKNAVRPSSTATGSVIATGIFVRAEWAWLALPVAVWLLSVVAVVSAFRSGNGVPLWKDNALPLAFLYRENGAVEGSHTYGTSGSDMYLRAEALRVRLISDGARALRLVPDAVE